VAIMASAMLGWGSFTWRRAELAMTMAQEALDQADKLELKLAESYLTKDEFNMQMDRLMLSLDRLEMKIDGITQVQPMRRRSDWSHITD